MATEASAERLLQSQTRLAAKLIGELGKQQKGGRVVVSPAGVGGVLTGIAAGSGPASQEIIAKILQIPRDQAFSSEIENLRNATANAKDGHFTSATRIIFNPSSPPMETAERKLSEAGIAVSVEDFMDPHTFDRVNAWVADVTHGKITNVQGIIAPDLKLAAINALYFKGRWENPFDAKETAPADFNTAEGQRVAADFMHTRPRPLRCREDDTFVAVDLPFKGGRFSFVIVTTKGAASSADQFADHLQWLSGQGFQLKDHVIVDMPRLKTVTNTALEQVLGRFADGVVGPFSNLTAGAASKLDSIAQTVDLTFDEEGGEVAAVTSGFELQSKILDSHTYEVLVDKPFAFALRDNEVGIVIAAGFVAKLDGPVLAVDSPLHVARSRVAMSEEMKTDMSLAHQKDTRTTLAPPSYPSLRIEKRLLKN